MSNVFDPTIIIPLKLRTGTHTRIGDADSNATHRFIYRPTTSNIHSIDVRRPNTDIELFPSGEDLDPTLFKNANTEPGTHEFLVEKLFFINPRAANCRLFVFSRIQSETGDEELIYNGPLLSQDPITGNPNFYLCQLHIEQIFSEGPPKYRSTFNAQPYSRFTVN